MFVGTLKEAINNIWPMLTIFLVVVVISRFAYLMVNGKKFVLYREILNLIFVIYLLLLFELVTNTESGNGGINLVPFTEIFRYEIGSSQFVFNVLGNIAVFIPFGFFIADYIGTKRLWHIVLITGITSLTIEIVQFRIGRACDIDDVMLNIVGGVLGYFLYIGLTAIKKHLPGILQKDIIYNIICLLLVILVILYLTNVFGYGWNF